MEKTIEQLDQELQEFKNKFGQHIHNGINSFKLFPKDFYGFTVLSVADASVVPTLNIVNGLPLFQVDNKSGTPHWYMWVKLPNLNATPVVNVWKSTQLT